MHAVILAGFLTVSMVRPIGFEPMAYSFGGQDTTRQVVAATADTAAVNSTAQPIQMDWSSIIAAEVAQILGDGGTTVYFLTGHGQSASHAGPCVEANPRFQPSDHQVAKIMVTKVALVGGLVALNYVAERWHPQATTRSSAEQRAKAATTVRIVSRGVNYFAATAGLLATVHNIGHCGI